VNRRALLAAAGTVTAGLAGCLAPAASGDGDGGDGAGAGVGAGGRSGTTTTAGEPFRTVRIGTPDAVAFPDSHRPHVVDVVNDGGAREVGLELEPRDDAGAAFDGVLAFPAGGRFRLRLIEPVDDELVVDPPGVDPSRVPLPAGVVDCSDSTTTVTVAADGGVAHETMSTDLACPPPEVVDRTFDADDGACAGDGAGTAAVALEDGTVRVTGSLRTPTPCYGAALETAALGDADTLRVVVAATEPHGDGVCIQCIGRVPYEATVEVAHGYPSVVVVEHVVDGRRREVARKRRDGG